MAPVTNRLVDQRHGIPGLGKVPVPKRRDGGGWEFFAFVTLALIASACATEFIAWRFHFHLPVTVNVHGQKLTTFAPPPHNLYAPWMAYVWYFHLGSGAAYNALTAAQKHAIDAVFYEAMAIVGAVLVIGLSVLRPLLRYRVPQVLADAEFGSDADVRKGGYVGGKGLILGKRKMSDRGVSKTEIIRANGEGHILLALGTGAKKGRAHITPSLLQDEWVNDTIILNDPPDEQWDRVSRAMREELGHYVFRCAWGKDRDKFPDVAPWNPWREIPLGDKRDSMVVALLAQKHVDRDGSGIKGRNRYFYEGAINIAQLAALTAAYAQGPQYGIRLSGAGIIEFVNDAVKDGDGLTGLVDFALNFDHTAGGKYRFIDGNGKPSNKHPGIVRLAGLVSQIKGEEAAPVIATFQQGFSIYAHPIIAQNTETSAFSVSMVQDYDRPLFITLSADGSDEDTLAPLHEAFFELLFAFNQSSKHLALDESGSQYCTHKREMWVLIDEAYSRGKIRGIEKGATTSRKFKIHIVPFYQTATQNEALYGKDNSIEGLMGMKVFSSAGESGAQEKISKYTGSHTIAYDTINIGERGGLSYSMHLNSAPLLKQDQVGRIDTQRIRLCVPLGKKPFIVETLDFGDVPLFARRAALGPNLFSDDLSAFVEQVAAPVPSAEDPLLAELGDVVGMAG